MNGSNPSPLTRIGVFYDGSYFYQVSNFYYFGHDRRSRISVSGLHEFICQRVAEEESTEARFCKIASGHYFRSRVSASEAQNMGNALYYDRVFDDILSYEGVTTHYLPVRSGRRGNDRDVDVWLALEAFDEALLDRFDVFVLIASDGNYSPLLRKLSSYGKRSMVLGWDFNYTSDDGRIMSMRTSQELLETATYPLYMHEVIDNRTSQDNPVINNMFTPNTRPKDGPVRQAPPTRDRDNDEREPIDVEPGEYEGTILKLLNGFGFIAHPDYPNNLFFHFQSTVGIEFSDLYLNDPVSFDIDQNDKGEDIAVNVQLILD